MIPMRKNTLLSLALLLSLAAASCAPQAPAAPSPLPAATVATPTPTLVSPTAAEPSSSLKQYTNDAFSLSFQYPASWFGPDEYVSGQTLRVAVGSDVVHPYGETPEEPSGVKNSYLVVVQYSKANSDGSWKDTVAALSRLKDGELLSGPRSLIIRVRQLSLGRFQGFEFISTLSETAQTDHVYSREVLLVDEQSNLLTILGSPNNVEVGSGANWRDVYRLLDEANLDAFQGLVASIKIE
jgi:hypothetical protein